MVLDDATCMHSPDSHSGPGAAVSADSGSWQAAPLIRECVPAPSDQVLAALALCNMAACPQCTLTTDLFACIAIAHVFPTGEKTITILAP